MSASIIFETARLGALIAYSDNQPQPPARFARKLAAWKQRNGVGRLMRKQPGRERPTYTSPLCFTLHEGEFGERGIILVTVNRTFNIGSDLAFRVIEQPRPGQVRIVQEVGDDTELLHLAEDRQAAELWLAKAGYSRARIEIVTADEVVADFVEGRAAA